MRMVTSLPSPSEKGIHVSGLQGVRVTGIKGCHIRFPLKGSKRIREQVTLPVYQENTLPLDSFEEPLHRDTWSPLHEKPSENFRKGLFLHRISEEIESYRPDSYSFSLLTGWHREGFFILEVAFFYFCWGGAAQVEEITSPKCIAIWTRSSISAKPSPLTSSTDCLTDSPQRKATSTRSTMFTMLSSFTSHGVSETRAKRTETPNVPGQGTFLRIS